LLASKLEAQGHKVYILKPYYPCDFLIKSSNGSTFIAEYKKRSHDFGTYPSVMITALKVANCKSLASAMNVKFCFLVEFNDGLYITSKVSGSVEYSGRKDRGDVSDMEPYIMVPLDNFIRIYY